MRPTTLSRIEKALAALRSHQPIILTDAGNREDEGDLIYPGSTITAEHIAFMLRHTSGIICLSLSAKKAKTLDLPFMVMRDQNSSRYGTPFTVSIEAKTGVTTGVSAQDRAKTIQTALAPQAKPQDLARPGHVFPLVAHQNGVFGRQGHTEGALDLIKLAGFEEGAVLCELMNPDGTMMRGDTLAAFSEQFDIPIASIADLIEYRQHTECLLTQKAETTLSLKGRGEFQATVFESTVSHQEIVVLHKAYTDTPLVRIHSACFTGDVLGSLHCDCQAQLQESLDLIHQKGGFLIYLPQEGRGIGLANKLKAYALQHQGFDTVEANLHLGFPADLREYDDAAQVLKYFGVKACELITRNPKKIETLERYGIHVTPKILKAHCHDQNRRYLQTKLEKLNHLFEEMFS